MTEAAITPAMSETGMAYIRAEFDRQMGAGLHPAAALAVFAGGRLVMDLTAGVADPAGRRAAGRGSLFRIFSCGKPLAAACLWVLHERGKLNWDDPVAKHWPEFAAKGKGRVTVKHVLTHQAGMPTTPKALEDGRNIADWGRCVAAMEDAELEFEPGSMVQYHPANFGWLVGELVVRISRRPFNQFFMDNVAGPLGLHETFFNLPPKLNTGVVKLKAMPGLERPETAGRFNNAASYAVVFPGGGCTASARDLARFYAALAAGGRIDGLQWLKQQTVAEVTALAAESVDPSIGRYQRRSLGLALSSDPPNTYASETGSRTFGHGGFASSTSWGDPGLGVAMAYITSGLQPDEPNRARLHAMSAAVRQAVTM